MKTMTIEQFLTWAFVQELPKAGAGEGGGSFIMRSASDMLEDVAELGTIIDRTPNAFGVQPGSIFEGEPHADAMLAGQAVKALAAHDGFEIPEGWNPFPEFDDEHGLIAAEVARVVKELTVRGNRINGKHVVNLVITSAVMGRGPVWSAEQPEIEMIGAHGKPAWFIQSKGKDAFGRPCIYETDGYDRKAQRPKPGAYRKHRLAWSSRGSILGRLDWQLWQSALEQLSRTFGIGLTEHRLPEFQPNRSPWQRTKTREISL